MKQKLMELGRSMVEMLGVLAIIGVLSIVGIQGYKKAMLKIKANDAWDAAMKFFASVEAHVQVTPGGDKCDGTHIGGWYVLAPSYDAIKNYPWVAAEYSQYCYWDEPDFLPPFANKDYDNFYLYVNRARTNVQFRNIKDDGLCSTILPDATQEGNKYIYKVIDNVQYRCFRRSDDVAW